jgi:hypothetical protein
MDVVFALRRACALSRAVALLFLTSCLWAASAHASATVTITVGAAPAESIVTQLGASGSVTDTNDYVVVHYKPTGGSACGANPSADNGTQVVDSSFLPTGPYAKSANVTFDPAGGYLACAWVVQSASPETVVAADAKTIVVRVPHLSLTLGVPGAVDVGQTFQVTTTTQAEVARDLYVSVSVDTGRGCPANASAALAVSASSTVVNGRSVVGGPATASTNLSLSTPGTYLVCGYLQHSRASDPPQATAAASLVVGAPPPPPPPCVVPVVVKDEPRAATKARLAAASCSVGKIRYVASARYARGSVFKVAPIAGTSLTNAARVDLFVSSGAPCIVPAIPRTRTLAAVERRLAQAGCTVGKLTHRRSRTVRRGRVVALSAAKGKRLAPRSRVGIVVSKGRAAR